MEYQIDKYSHKLSVNNKISYEIARNIIEKNIEKLQSKFPTLMILLKNHIYIQKNKLVVIKNINLKLFTRSISR